MSDYAPTSRTRLRRKPARARYDRATVHAILDEAFVGHLAWCGEAGPVCLPTVYARQGESVVLHGSAASGSLRALREGARACVTVTLVDGLVYGRSAFRSSVNYRSVVLFGAAREVAEPGEKAEALRAIVEHAMPGRFGDVRPPEAKEMRQTLVLRVPLEEVSAKVREGFPADDGPDYARRCWAGVLPLALRAGEPVDDPRLLPGLRAPAHVRGYARPVRRGTS